ncbi:MAG: ferredoxin family protein [Eubacteriales bacterium]|nr:ferredoxin family protein [Eubacteriales bacterium]
MNLDQKKCVGCKRCEEVCPMEIKAAKHQHPRMYPVGQVQNRLQGQSPGDFAAGAKRTAARFSLSQNPVAVLYFFSGFLFQTGSQT